MDDRTGGEAGRPELPRERLLSVGPRALSDADLISLVLGTGTAHLSARAAALSLVEAVPVAELAWAPPRRGERCLDRLARPCGPPCARAPRDELPVV